MGSERCRPTDEHGAAVSETARTIASDRIAGRGRRLPAPDTESGATGAVRATGAGVETRSDAGAGAPVKTGPDSTGLSGGDRLILVWTWHPTARSAAQTNPRPFRAARTREVYVAASVRSAVARRSSLRSLDVVRVRTRCVAPLDPFPSRLRGSRNSREEKRSSVFADHLGDPLRRREHDLNRNPARAPLRHLEGVPLDVAGEPRGSGETLPGLALAKDAPAIDPGGFPAFEREPSAADTSNLDLDGRSCAGPEWEGSSTKTPGGCRKFCHSENLSAGGQGVVKSMKTRWGGSLDSFATSASAG